MSRLPATASALRASTSAVSMASTCRKERLRMSGQAEGERARRPLLPPLDGVEGGHRHEHVHRHLGHLQLPVAHSGTNEDQGIDDKTKGGR